MRFIDFFAGIGGFRLGLEMAGHECVGHCEIDKYADRSYRAMHDVKEGEWFADDITRVRPEDLPEAEVYCGGFPCQAFSIAGKRGGFEDTRGTLFFEIMRLAKVRRPKYLFLENVRGLLSHDGGRTFGTILQTMGELGYDAEWQILNSKDYGVPQNRERVFIIGHLRGAGGREVFPIEGANGEVDTPIEIIAHRKGYRRNTQVFSPNGITETLDTGQGGGRGHYTIIDDTNTGFNGVKTYEDMSPTLRSERHGLKVMPVLTPERIEKRQNGRRFKEDGEPSFTLTSQDRHGIMLTRNEIKRKTDISHTLMARDYKGIGNQEMSAVMEIRPVITPDRETKRQNGRRFKDDGEDMFTLTAQDRHGVAILAPTRTEYGKAIRKQYEAGEIEESRHNMTKLEPRSDGMTNTISTVQKDNLLYEKCRIRRLTPKECFRLQGFPDELFEKAAEVNSDSQLYKQAGNSVTVNVIYEIAKRLRDE